MAFPVDTGLDRRRSARVDAFARVLVVVRSRPLLALLRHINATGFTLETALPVEVGESLRFELHFPGSTALVDATCVHCAPNMTWVEGSFVAGFAFDALEGPARMVVTDFITDLVVAGSERGLTSA
jgi:hypothetical protein